MQKNIGAHIILCTSFETPCIYVFVRNLLSTVNVTHIFGAIFSFNRFNLVEYETVSNLPPTRIEIAHIVNHNAIVAHIFHFGTWRDITYLKFSEYFFHYILINFLFDVYFLFAIDRSIVILFCKQ